jgi:hypothetical protein
MVCINCNQNSYSCFRDNRNFVFFIPFVGVLNLGTGTFIFTGHRPRMAKLLNIEYEQNPFNRSGASVTYIYTLHTHRGHIFVIGGGLNRTNLSDLEIVFSQPQYFHTHTHTHTDYVYKKVKILLENLTSSPSTKFNRNLLSNFGAKICRKRKPDTKVFVYALGAKNT